jgi:hypothetical protein
MRCFKFGAIQDGPGCVDRRGVIDGTIAHEGRMGPGRAVALEVMAIHTGAFEDTQAEAVVRRDRYGRPKRRLSSSTSAMGPPAELRFSACPTDRYSMSCASDHAPMPHSASEEIL